MKRVVTFLYHTRDHAITYFKNCKDMLANEPVAWEAGVHPLDWKRDSKERFRAFTRVLTHLSVMTLLLKGVQVEKSFS